MTLLIAYFAPCSFAQPKGPNDFPKLNFTHIDGAPLLTNPQLIMTETKPAVGEGMGWASPYFYDLDGDGKNELLIGEFGSLTEQRLGALGSFVRVYKNIGSKEHPRYSDAFEYLKPATHAGNGAPLSIYTWCCLGFTPRIIDLDQDGFDDLLTGSYNPGDITWFRGTADGFLMGQKIPQFGDLIGGSHQFDHSISRTDSRSLEYWNYSSADFQDLDGDGLVDMVVAGNALRFSKNIGTKENPVFGKRELLRDPKGNPLSTYVDSVSIRNGAGELYYGSSSVPTLVDWDRDGILDLLVTDSYSHPGYHYPVTFFKGIRSDSGVLFEKGIPLFTVGDHEKAFPGTYQQVTVTDYNGDGIPDLVIGTKVAVVNDQFDWDINWEWESKQSLPRISSAYLTSHTLKYLDKTLAAIDSMQLEKGLSDEEWNAKYSVTKESALKPFYGENLKFKNLAYQGYVYVLLGKENEN